MHGTLAATSTAHSCGDILRQKCKRAVLQVAGGSRGASLLLLHLHADVGMWTVRTKDDTSDRRTERRNAALTQEEGPSFDENVDTISIQRREKEIFTSACLMFAAIEAVQYRSSRDHLSCTFNVEVVSQSQQSTGSVSSTQNDFVALCHGQSFAVVTSAFGRPARELENVRSPPGAPGLVLILHKVNGVVPTIDSLRSSTPSNDVLGGSHAESSSTGQSYWGKLVTVIPRECCLAISLNQGLLVQTLGWSRHGEGETRIVSAHIHCSRALLKCREHLDETVPRKDQAYRFPNGPKNGCVVVSMESDCPAIYI